MAGAKMSKEEKRALAVEKLAKVLGRGRRSAAAAGGDDSEDEADVLEAILASETLEDAKRLARERLDRGDSGKRYAQLVKQDRADAAAAPQRIDAVLRSLHRKTHDAAATRAGYWRDNFAHGLAVERPAAGHSTDAGAVPRLSSDEARVLNEHLARTGFFTSASMPWGDDISLPQIVSAMADLKREGWPAAFVFAYREPWLIIERLFDFVGSLLGTEDLAIEPSVFAWLLDPPSGHVSKAGNNGFHLPHRDFTFAETFDACGDIKTLSVWLPLSDVDARNGCMFVLPKEFDDAHDQPNHPAHLRAATPTRNGALTLQFPLQGIRPLEAPAGAVLGWHGNTIHWGSRCASDAPFPRASIAVTFCRASVGCLEGNTLLTRQDVTALDLKGRLSAVAWSLIMHKRWFPLEDSMVPPALFSE